MEIIAVIPARFASTRLPGKPLLSATGRTLIQHVVEAAWRSKRIEKVVVATDDQRIFDAVREFGGEAIMTRVDHPSGTDRIAEVAESFPDASIFVNLQGDEPEVTGESLDLLVEKLEDDNEAPMATLATPIYEESIYRDPSCVKVVGTESGRALYFSRSPIPLHRDGLPSPSDTAIPLGYLHLGLYAYRRDFLLMLGKLPQTPLEKIEKLEQLRVLELGYPIALGIVEDRSIGIDTPADYARFLERWNRQNPANQPPTGQ